MSTLKPLMEESDDADDGIISLKANNIAIHRSDGVKHDLVTVFNKSGITAVVDSAVEQSKSKKAAVTEDRGKINIHRSDGLKHDIGAFIRSQSEINVASSAKSKFSWQNFAPKISFTKYPSPTHTADTSAAPRLSATTEKRPSGLTTGKDMGSGYHPRSVRIVHMSDTFNLLKASGRHKYLPDGDILVHSGNFTVNGTDDEFGFFDSWLASVKDIYHYRVICLGHRDVRRFGTEWDVLKALLPNATHVLCNEEATILGINFYGCPWHWGYKFNYSLKTTAPPTCTTRYNDIPDGIDVLITHGPAHMRLDRTIEGENWGSRELAEAIVRTKPSVHLHGHLAEGRGFLPAFGHYPLTLNSSMCERTRQVMYACPQVVKCTQIFAAATGSSAFDSKKDSPTWEFGIDSYE